MVAIDYLLFRPYWFIAPFRKYAGSLSSRTAYRADVGPRALFMDLPAIGLGRKLFGFNSRSGRLRRRVWRSLWDLCVPGSMDIPLSQNLTGTAPFRLVSGSGNQFGLNC